MLEEVISNWEKYSSTVASLQAWLEDGEQMLNQSENAKRVSTNTDTSYCTLCNIQLIIFVLRKCKSLQLWSLFLFLLLGFLQKPLSLDAAAHGHERRRELSH